MTSPYDDLPRSSFWRSAVAETDPAALEQLYTKRFGITREDRIATAGSCFAQNVARYLRKNAYQIVDTEALPDWMPAELAKSFGYGLYSARYGNIYTVRQLRQLIDDSLSGTVRDEDVWEKDGRFYDALRPSVEPDGLDSAEEVKAHRRDHLARVAEMVRSSNIFIFTLGLTEAWELKGKGTVYPTAPGVIAGTFDAATHGFVNFDMFQIFEDLVAVREAVLSANPGMKFLLTVSPVPLTATASGDHVLTATIRSKSILRAVCAAFYDRFEDVDYFPSYEIITSPGARSDFFSLNLRSVTETGVDAVMKVFFAAHSDGTPAPQAEPKPSRRVDDDEDEADDVVCEEALLEAFGR